MVGNCLAGTHLRRMATSSQQAGPNNVYWQGGYIFGHFRGCGWVEDDYLSDVSPLSEVKCQLGSVGYNQSEFQSGTNEAATAAQGGCTRQTVAPFRCQDGTAVNNSVQCPFYANIGPWEPNRFAEDPMPSIPANSGWIRWRYRTKYPDLSGVYWVLIHNTNVVSTLGNWGFVPQWCVDSLPGWQAV